MIRRKDEEKSSAKEEKKQLKKEKRKKQRQKAYRIGKLFVFGNGEKVERVSSKLLFFILIGVYFIYLILSSLSQ